MKKSPDRKIKKKIKSKNSKIQKEKKKHTIVSVLEKSDYKRKL